MRLDLLLADHVALIKIDMSVKLADEVTELGERVLQRDPVVARQRKVVCRPVAAPRRAALHAVGCRNDSERIGIGKVVSLDHLVIPGYEKRRTVRTAGKQQVSLD